MNASDPLNYSSGFVRNLFDEMSSTYGVMNTLTSFGFSERWRCQAVKALDLPRDATLCDLMCGMGESWKYIRHHHPHTGKLIGADFSEHMCDGARKKAARMQESVCVHPIDVLQDDWPEDPVDAVVCTFGLKTLDNEGLEQLGQRLTQILRPGGQFSFVEISVPESRLLRAPYLLYLDHIIPILGRIFLGNPENYRCLGRYTRAFQNGRRFHDLLLTQGHEVHYRELFSGCASLVSGRVAGLGV